MKSARFVGLILSNKEFPNSKTRLSKRLPRFSHFFDYPTSIASWLIGDNSILVQWLPKLNLIASPTQFRSTMKFLEWYVKIAVVSSLIGGSMELFMIKTGFYDKVTELESEKRAWESSPEAQAMREALNPWRNRDPEAKKNS
ncbi:hypothetical protein SAY86_030795 [Trapa natans]|uniref:Uncharacterized protein n=1 Tax=Trapa natans TaxID=22666 RepID=A0AAN7RAY4_TRANT|nr:hypothetical protein SAY86_030795 [Trapa natans]